MIPPPLKFRTAGFPKYGFKASMSDRAFLHDCNLKLASGIRGPWLRFELCCLDPSSLTTTHAPVSPARCDFTTLSLIRSAFAVRERQGDPRDLFATVLSLHDADPTPVLHRALPLYSHSGSRLPRIISESPTTAPVSASYHRRVALFGTASFTLCYGLQVWLALLTGYDVMKSHALHRAF
jgi:hypothetical protein